MTTSRSAKITDEHRKEAAALRAIWNDGRSRRTQAVFGEHYNLGNQANVGHYLSARSPLNLKAAMAFAEELDIAVGDFSPRLARELEKVGAGAVAVKAMAPSPAPDEDAVHVPLLANAGSMGLGTDQHSEDVIVGSIALSPNWISKEVRPTRAEALRFIHAYGDSMTPTFTDGDVLLVDTGARDPSIDGVYVLQAHQRIFIKRVRQRLDGKFEVSSDNPTVKTIDVLDGNHEVDVLGRVVYTWNGRKL